MKKIYETIIILDAANRSEKYLNSWIIDLSEHLQRFSTEKKVKTKIMGKKSLAYDIKEHKTGYYVLFAWQGTDTNTSDLEKHLRIDDVVLKFITVTKNEDDLENFKSEVKTKQKLDAVDILFNLGV